MGRPYGVVALAARHEHPAVRDVLLGCPGALPAARCPRRQPGRANGRPAAVPGVHARGHRRAVGHDVPAVRQAGRFLRRRALGGPRSHAAPGRVRDLRRHVPVPARRGRLVRGPRRPAAGRDRVDGRHRGGAGPGQRDQVRLSALRSGRGGDRDPERVVPAGRAEGGAVPGRRTGRVRDLRRDPARHGRRWLLRGGHWPDHPDQDERYRLADAHPGRLVVMVPDRGDCRPGGGSRRPRHREVPAPEAGTGGAGRRSVAGAGRAGPYPHPDLAGQARGLRGLVRGHRRGLRRQQADRSLPAPVAARRGHGGDRRRSRGAGPAGSRAGALTGAAVAQRDPVLPRLRPPGRSLSGALPGRDAVHSRVLSAARGPLAVVVEYPECRPAQWPQHQRSR